jgi:hypothetical protein
LNEFKKMERFNPDRTWTTATEKSSKNFFVALQPYDSGRRKPGFIRFPE